MSKCIIRYIAFIGWIDILANVPNYVKKNAINHKRKTWKHSNLFYLVKFRFSKKATKFGTISHMSNQVGDCFKFLWSFRMSNLYMFYLFQNFAFIFLISYRLELSKAKLYNQVRSLSHMATSKSVAIFTWKYNEVVQ